MASSIPVQTRAVDPYASYNSNVVNQLTGIVTRGFDGLDIFNALQVVPDTTSSDDHVVVLQGTIYKDEVLIDITEEFRLDFTDPNHYLSPPANPFEVEAGIYYVCLEYAYVKSRPAPQAHIKILLPIQTSAFRAGNFPSLFFLKAVEVSCSGGVCQIDGLYDYDPDNEEIVREYIKSYAGPEVFLPTFNQERDQSRIVYLPQTDEFYFGYSDRWGTAGGTAGGGAIIERDTSTFEVGDLVYLTSAGNVALASSTFAITTADGAVTKSDVNGIVTTNGRVTEVKMEPGVSVGVGNLLYLSDTVPGTVTNVKPSPSWQFVGRCTSLIDSTSLNMLFVRGEPFATATGIVYGVSVTGSASSGSWTPSGGLSYQDVDISAIDNINLVISIWDSTTGFKIEPENIEFPDSNTLRIWMPGGFSGDLDFMIIGASSSASSGSIDVVTDVISGVDWVAQGAFYYGVVDTSDLDLSFGSVVKCYNSSDEVVVPTAIEYDSSSVTVWMPISTEDIKVVAAGYTSNPTAQGASISITLASGGSWVVDSGLYYQDFNITQLFTDDVVFETVDLANNEKIEVSKAAIPTSGILRIWMPDTTHDVYVTVVG